MITNTENRVPTPTGTGSATPPPRTERSSDTLAVSSGPAEAIEAIDLGGNTDYPAGEEPRFLWANGAGDIKVDGYKRDGKTASTGVTITVAQAGRVDVGRVTKVYGTAGGTTVSVVACW